MPYTVINPSRHAPGEPVKGDWGTDVVNNLDDHESRIGALETIGAKIIILNDPAIGLSQYAGTSTITIFTYRAAQNMNIVSAELYQITPGSSGATEIDVRVGATESTGSTIFSTKPIVTPGNGSEFVDGGTISDGSVSEGEFITLDFTQIQVSAEPVHVRIIAEPV